MKGSLLKATVVGVPCLRSELVLSRQKDSAHAI
jgi:hypothetical protein